MFVYKVWERFCCELDKSGVHSVCAIDELHSKDREFLILKHDVETNPKKALKLAQIEAKYGHKGSYYVQFYLLKNSQNLKILKKIQSLGHEVSYHHDVMDSNAGNIDKAIKSYEENSKVFAENGFEIKTVCQHGNPIVNRIGYHSNRDFFRNEKVRKMFSEVSEIMVDYKQRIDVPYLYISDAGYNWKIIFDPENNDIIDSDDKNIPLEDLKGVEDVIYKSKSVIVSTHPHRWHKNAIFAIMKDCVFKLVKNIAKAMLKISVAKKIMEKFYFIAKKI